MQIRLGPPHSVAFLHQVVNVLSISQPAASQHYLIIRHKHCQIGRCYS